METPVNLSILFEATVLQYNAFSSNNLSGLAIAIIATPRI